MFFWFFPAGNGDANAPVLLWLQGGPGGSSLFGLFVENGPVHVNDQGYLVPNPGSWNTEFAMLYIDNPVGTGFSFTDQDAGYSTTEVEVGANLYSALSQFFVVFSDYAVNDFYITGESYAGKYVPAIAHTIFVNNQNPNNKAINLVGIAIGDGISDPISMVPEYPNLIFNAGLADLPEKAILQNMTDGIVANIQQQNWMQAFLIFDEMLNGDLYPYPSYYANITGGTNYYNFLLTQEPDYGPYDQFLNECSVRTAIHVGDLPYGATASLVEKHLLIDFMQSVAEYFPDLMETYKVMLYSGQLDIIVGYPLTETFVRTINWSGAGQYADAPKILWKVNPTDGEYAGYMHNVNNFWQVIVKGGGHILPFDQPERCLDLITRFVTDNMPAQPSL